MIKETDSAPLFTLPSTTDHDIALESLRGNPVVLYFYPKDETPGCTREACSLRDNFEKIKDKAFLIGISPDSVESHTAFITHHSLPFPLLSDTQRTVFQAYECLKESGGIIRSTFLIDREGKIVKIWRHVNVLIHTGQVIKALDSLHR